MAEAIGWKPDRALLDGGGGDRRGCIVVQFGNFFTAHASAATLPLLPPPLFHPPSSTHPLSSACTSVNDVMHRFVNQPFIVNDNSFKSIKYSKQKRRIKSLKGNLFSLSGRKAIMSGSRDSNIVKLHDILSTQGRHIHILT